MGIKERQDRERQAVREAILTPRATCSSPKATGMSRSARSPSGSSTARPRSTATSPARTTSSSRWPPKASRASTPRSRRPPADRRPARGPAHLLVGVLPVLQGPARVLPADVRRPLGAGHHRAVAGLRVPAADARARRRAHSARHRRRPLPRRAQPASGAARAVGGADRTGRARLHLPPRSRRGPRRARARRARTPPSPAWPPARPLTFVPCLTQRTPPVRSSPSPIGVTSHDG